MAAIWSSGRKSTLPLVRDGMERRPSYVTMV
jgi:hypothetical protein